MNEHDEGAFCVLSKLWNFHYDAASGPYFQFCTGGVVLAL